MNLSSSAQATLLLTSHFSRRGGSDAKPLSNVEWGRFAFWLKQKDMTPGDLLSHQVLANLDGWHDVGLHADRVGQLLGRGHALALAVEKWQRAGLWVLTRSDEGYPRFLKRRLKTQAPPVLYGCGDSQLLNHGGLAVVGSRDIDQDDMDYARELGSKAAAAGIPIVSGGAKGVDESAMLGAMDAGGVVVGVLANKLLSQATSSKWRRGLMDGTVVLVSPFYPEAGFNAGNAMARNKYIYCLSQAALVVRCGSTGGTISGATENLKQGWVPLWVKPTSDASAANGLLVNKGGRWCDEPIGKLDVSALLLASSGSEAPEVVAPLTSDTTKGRQEQGSLFDRPQGVAEPDAPMPEPEVAEPSAPKPERAGRDADANVDFYAIFVDKLPFLLREPSTLDGLLEVTNLSKSQLQKWMKQAEEDGVVNKLNRPVRYELTGR